VVVRAPSVTPTLDIDRGGCGAVARGDSGIDGSSPHKVGLFGHFATPGLDTMSQPLETRTTRGRSVSKAVSANCSKRDPILAEVSAKRKRSAEMARSGSQERTKGASQQAQGRLKEAIGALTGNRRQASQGRADQGRGRLRERWGHLKDALRR